jgi:hypothetical protein
MRPISIFLLVSAALLLVGLYKTFEKAGEKGWKAFIPVYNFLVWLKIIKKPWWWIFLILIPTVGFYMLAIMPVAFELFRQKKIHRSSPRDIRLFHLGALSRIFERRKIHRCSA